MAYKDLLLTLASYPETAPPSAIDLASDFAAAIGAKISAIACKIRVAVPGSFLSPALLDVPGMAATDEKKSRLQAEASLAAFQAAAEKRGVFEERILERCLTSEQRELLVEYARLRDLTIIPVQDNALFGADYFRIRAPRPAAAANQPQAVRPEYGDGGLGLQPSGCARGRGRAAAA
ncbi:hypothetical protein AAFX91_32030 [Bradyrhizobium sp. 31Argb]|uniref:hypothetical protein n=1 Tax=Bradyrhizobium sp. 31Argb TaxID=3141247 RepID=UPI00374A1141